VTTPRCGLINRPWSVIESEAPQAATLLLAEGEHPKVVQELLGHAQVSITLDRYSHMTPRLMSNAAALMDRLLDGEEPSSPTPNSG
jgi:integrase